MTWKDPFSKFLIPLGAGSVKVFALRQRAAFFGNNAPAWLTMPFSVREAYGDDTNHTLTEWPNFKVQNNLIDLDAVYPKVTVDSWVVLTKPLYVQLHKAVSVTSALRAPSSRLAPRSRASRLTAISPSCRLVPPPPTSRASS